MPPQNGFLKNLQVLYAVKPIQRRTFTIENSFEPQATTEFKMKFTGFKYSREINSSDIYIYRQCYNKELGLPVEEWLKSEEKKAE
jgi:Txe/YoeB family toxin of Txe-Axe toxin-antitoxin module